MFGRSRARRVAAIRELVARQQSDSVDDGPGPGWLVVTDAPRRPEAWAAALATGERALLPELWTPDGLLAWLWHRFGDGRPWLERQARELAARRWLRDHAKFFDPLARIRQGPELAWHLATVDDALGQQRVVQMSDPEMDRVVKALREAHPAAFVRPAEATVRLLERLVQPSEGLARWLERHPVVVIDDVLQPSPMRGTALIALAQAAAEVGSTVIVTLASGRDRGGREAGVLLGWDTADEALREESRVVAAQAPLRQALFGLVESGELEVVCQTREGTMAIEPWTEPAPASPRDLADAYADGRSLPIVSTVQARSWLGDGRVTLLRCSDPEDEATEAARALQQALLDGTHPADAVIAVSDLPRQEAIVADALDTHGVPWTLERPLVELPLAQVVLGLLAVACPEPEPDALCALADALIPQVAVDPRRVRRWLLRAGIGPGPVTAWSRSLVRWLDRNRIQTGGDLEDPEGPLQRTLAALDGLHAEARALEGEVTPRHLRDTLEHLLDAHGELSSDAI
ncbi:MAG: hypothetical protein AAF602_33025, partial [Myxococcota bacterium]